MSSFINKFKKKRSDSQLSKASMGSEQARSLSNLPGANAHAAQNSRNSADFSAYSVGGSGAMASAQSASKHRRSGRDSSIGSAYRDGSIDKARQTVVAESMTEVAVADLKDLQTTVQINKEIIKSLVEAQKSDSPTHTRLKQSLQMLN